MGKLIRQIGDTVVVEDVAESEGIRVEVALGFYRWARGWVDRIVPAEFPAIKTTRRGVVEGGGFIGGMTAWGLSEDGVYRVNFAGSRRPSLAWIHVRGEEVDVLEDEDQARARVFGKNSAQEYRHAVAERDRLIGEQNREAGLPALAGTPKQIAWAEAIRKRILDLVLARLDLVPEPCPRRYELLLTLRLARQQKSAKWWIEHRNDDPESLLYAVRGNAAGYDESALRDLERSLGIGG